MNHPPQATPNWPGMSPDCNLAAIQPPAAVGTLQTQCWPKPQLP